jgi:hypothetical protein
MQKTQRRLIPDPIVCRGRYRIHPTTLRNWDNDPELKFPKAIRIKTRKFRDEAELDDFDRRLAAERETKIETAA